MGNLSKEEVKSNSAVSLLLTDKGTVSLQGIVQIFIKRVRLVVVSTIMAGAASVALALWLPNIYTSHVLVAPSTPPASMLPDALGGLGGIASLAGVEIGDKATVSSLDVNLATMQSREFIFSFTEKYNIGKDLIAYENWDRVTGKDTYNPKIYDSVASKWIRKPSGPWFTTEPSLQEIHKEFLEILQITEDDKTGLVSISVRHQSPVVSHRWVRDIVHELNEYVRLRDKSEALASIKYLEDEISKSSIAELNTALYELVQDQYKKMMLAETSRDYAFKVIDPPVVPQLKSGPHRALLCILFTLGGFILGLLIALTLDLYYEWRKRRYIEVKEGA